MSGGTSVDPDTMPKKKTSNFGHPRNEQVGETAVKFKQVEIPGKGQGLVATERLPVGRAA